MVLRVAAYFDGYNLYHAIKRLNRPHLKWVDLWALADVFIPSKTAHLVAVHYFSAFAEWLPVQRARHEAYVAALAARGVSVHMANFKEKSRRCPSCHHSYKAHEEKETDVNLAVSILAGAINDDFDRALIVSRDSDLVPAARVFKQLFPGKQLGIVAPPHQGHSNEMLQLCDLKHKIQAKHLERCLLPGLSIAANGDEIQRPVEYTPPSSP